MIAEKEMRMVVESTDSAATTQPSKLRVPGSIPGAPTTKPLKTNGEEQPAPGQVDDVQSANQGLSGAKLRNNCGSHPPAPAWRSMASAPRDATVISLMRSSGTIVTGRRAEPDWDMWTEQGGMADDDWSATYLAWAPIPEWTGKVAE